MSFKKIVAGLLSLIPFKTHLTSEDAHKILMDFQPRPLGTCWANNKIDIQYDLQIIIPVYNMEKYIESCLRSVISQNTRYSVLTTVINDGSTDNTAEIIKKTLKEVGEEGKIKFEVINQENKGFSGARNTGLRLIRGKYIMLIDADDILPDKTIENMIKAADIYQADILQGSWYTFDDIHRDNNIIKEQGAVKDNRVSFSGFPWGKLYKSNVLKNFQFPEGFWFEDTPISFILYAMPYRYAALKDIIYGYRQNPEGICATSVYSKKAVDSYWITEECLREFPNFGIEYNQRAYDYLLRQSIMNARRAKYQPISVRKAEFVLTAELIKRYFEGFGTEDPVMKKIESALRKKQFVKFEMLKVGF